MALILVVDDGAVVLRVARLVLKREGHSVITARSPAEALEEGAKLNRLDVLIANCGLPPDWGRDVAELLLLRFP